MKDNCLPFLFFFLLLLLLLVLLSTWSYLRRLGGGGSVFMIWICCKIGKYKISWQTSYTLTHLHLLRKIKNQGSKINLYSSHYYIIIRAPLGQRACIFRSFFFFFSFCGAAPINFTDILLFLQQLAVLDLFKMHSSWWHMVESQW